jgi:hypothetical protein
MCSPRLGGSCRTAANVSGIETRRNGDRPLSISARITPNEKRSDRRSSARPLICSGDM